VLRRALAILVASCAALAIGCVGLVVAAVASMKGAAGEAPPRTGRGPPETALAVPEPVALDRSGITAEWAALTRTTVVYSTPSPGARPVGRVGGITPEGTANVVLVERAAQDAGGEPWALVRFPGGPTGRAGWTPRGTLGPGGVSRSRLVVDRSRRTITLYRSGRAVLSAPVGVGRARTPTPAGSFYIRNRLSRYASARYGPLAFGTSARSRLTDWPGGGFIGIHGTNRPELLPGAVSHGCIRMRNRDILRLGGMLRVGTPLVIV
jgi:lipoprotein-anchoring transpeptidase ErfK/SrfK